MIFLFPLEEFQNILNKPREDTNEDANALCMNADGERAGPITNGAN